MLTPALLIGLTGPVRSESEDQSDRVFADACFESVLDNKDDGYCEVLIDELTALPSRTAIQQRQLTAALNNRAILLMRSGDGDGALEVLNDALAMDPEVAVLYLTRGNLMLNAKRWQDALSDYDHALLLNNTLLAAAQFNRVFALRGLGNIRDARLELLKAERTDTPSTDSTNARQTPEDMNEPVSGTDAPPGNPDS